MAHVILVLFSRTVVPLFFFGLVGSAAVVVATLVRDLGEVTSPDTKTPGDL